jgi:SlyX protein
MSSNTPTQDLLLSELLQRLADAESRIAFQEDTLQILGDQLAHQQQLGARLQTSLQLLYRQIQDLQHDGNTDINILGEDESPPHY